MIKVIRGGQSAKRVCQEANMRYNVFLYHAKKQGYQPRVHKKIGGTSVRTSSQQGAPQSALEHETEEPPEFIGSKRFDCADCGYVFESVLPASRVSCDRCHNQSPMFISKC